MAMKAISSSSLTNALIVTVNGEALTTLSVSLADLVIESGHGGTNVATAVNGAFVPERKRAGTALNHGDRIEILSPRQGG